MNLTEKYKVLHDEKDFKFYVQIEQDEAYIDYRWYQDKLILLYIFVPPPFRGKGISNVLIQHALQFAREKGAKINIYCPYIAKYVRSHPEYHDLLENR